MTTPAAPTSVRHEVVVDAPIERAFSVFTKGFGSFKPAEHNMLAVDIAEPVFELHEGGSVYDKGVDGSECHWARVLAYDPPNRVGSAGISARNGKSRLILRKPARSMCDSSPRRQTARGSSSNIGTSIATATVGRPSARGSMRATGGRCIYAASPTWWPHDRGATDRPIQTEKEARRMAPIVTSIEIDRPQDDVFAYVIDPTRFAEWQAGVEGGSTEGGTSPSVGSKCTTMRRVGGTARQVTSEITKINPPHELRHSRDPRPNPGDRRRHRRATQRQRAVASDDRTGLRGTRHRQALVPLIVRRQARNEMPANCRKLKQQLEGLQSPASCMTA